MNTKITMTAIGLLAAGVWLLWPSITAPTILRASHYCIAVHNDAGCSAHAICTFTALETTERGGRSGCRKCRAPAFWQLAAGLSGQRPE